MNYTIEVPSKAHLGDACGLPVDEGERYKYSMFIATNTIGVVKRDTRLIFKNLNELNIIHRDILIGGCILHDN